MIRQKIIGIGCVSGFEINTQDEFLLPSKNDDNLIRCVNP